MARTFHSLKVGEKASLSKEITSTVVEAFADVSNDHNPLHLDDAFAKTTQYGQRIAHGMISAGLISAVQQARRLTRATGRAGLVTGAVIGTAFAVVGLFAGHFFSPTPHIQTLIAVGMVTMGIFFPLQGWMMAIDGILIGARDYRYLAVTCTLTAVVYVTLILILANMVTPALTSDLMRTAVLWAAFNVVLMGGRGLSNGLRVRSDAWMR